MKKTLLITLPILMGLMFAFSMSAHAATMTVDDIKYYYVEGEDTCTVSAYASGTQAVIRKTDTEAMVVVHAFKNPSESFEIVLDKKYEISDEFCNSGIVTINGNILTINKQDELSAVAVKLKAI